MLQERDTYWSLLDTSSGGFISQEQELMSQIHTLENTVEGYCVLVERVAGDLEKAMKVSGNHIPLCVA
jgi:hypothetical protein